MHCRIFRSESHNSAHVSHINRCLWNNLQVWRFSDNAFVIDPTNEVGEVESVCVGGRDGLPGSQWLFRNVFQMSVPTALCRINEPPVGKDVNVVTEEDLNGRFVTFLLERDVFAGEELFIDYGLSYDRSMYGKSSETVSAEEGAPDQTLYNEIARFYMVFRAF